MVECVGCPVCIRQAEDGAKADVHSGPARDNAEPKREELLRWLFRPIRTKRLRKKFLKKLWDKYPHYVQKPVWEEYQRKIWRNLGELMSNEIRSQLMKPGLTRRLLTVSYPPQGEIAERNSI